MLTIHFDRHVIFILISLFLFPIAFPFTSLLKNRFTGWVDSNLAEKGVAEAHHAAALLRDGGYTFDRVCVLLLLLLLLLLLIPVAVTPPC